MIMTAEIFYIKRTMSTLILCLKKTLMTCSVKLIIYIYIYIENNIYNCAYLSTFHDKFQAQKVCSIWVLYLGYIFSPVLQNTWLYEGVYIGWFCAYMFTYPWPGLSGYVHITYTERNINSKKKWDSARAEHWRLPERQKSLLLGWLNGWDTQHPNTKQFSNMCNIYTLW